LILCVNENLNSYPAALTCCRIRRSSRLFQVRKATALRAAIGNGGTLLFLVNFDNYTSRKGTLRPAISVTGTEGLNYLRYMIVVISNQAGLSLKPDPKGSRKRLSTFKDKASAVLNQLDMPVSIYAATEKDIYRKPRIGMWTELLDDYDISSDNLDLEHSIFVGDAAGRHAEAGKSKDFSCSDRYGPSPLLYHFILTQDSNFAGNIGLRFYTPEEFFLNEAPRAFSRPFEPSDFLPDPAAKGSSPCNVWLLDGNDSLSSSSCCTFYKK
jgi:DNA 3'-phosphatase